MAPGEVTCALNQPGYLTTKKQGTSVAAALISGLAALLLSLDDLGPVLRSVTSVPLAVREWIADKAYIRGDGIHEDGTRTLA